MKKKTQACVWKTDSRVRGRKQQQNKKERLKQKNEMVTFINT